VPFCPECKAMAYPKDGKLSCRRCGWSGGATEKRLVTKSADTREQVVIEEQQDSRQQHDTECPKCGHGRAYFHLMQTRRSDEPPTTINECMECGHKWREY
jgi:transcription factor S